MTKSNQDEIQQLIEDIDKSDPDLKTFAAKAVRENPEAFGAILEKARREGELRLAALLIDTFDALSVYDDPIKYQHLLLPRGKPTRMKYGDLELTGIVYEYPQPYKSNEEADAAMRKLDQTDYETLKQKTGDIIARASLRLLIVRATAQKSKVLKIKHAGIGGRPNSTRERNRLVREIKKELNCTPSDNRFWPTYEARAEDKLAVPGRKGTDRHKWSELSKDERDRAHETVLRQERDSRSS